MSSQSSRIGLTLLDHISGCIVKSVSDSAVFDGIALKPNDIITRINGGPAHQYQTIFKQGDPSTPYRLSFVSAGRTFETTMYKYAVTGDSSPPPSTSSAQHQQQPARTGSAGSAPQYQQQPVGRTASADSHASYPSSQPAAVPPYPFAPPQLQDLQALANAAYVPPLAPGQLPVVQMRIPGSSAAMQPAAAAAVPAGAQQQRSQQQYHQQQQQQQPYQQQQQPYQQQQQPYQQHHQQQQQPYQQQQHQQHQHQQQAVPRAGQFSSGLGKPSAQSAPQYQQHQHQHQHQQHYQQQQHQQHQHLPKPCPYFAQGICKFGAGCRDIHSGASAASAAAPPPPTSFVGQLYSGAVSLASGVLGVVGAAGSLLGLGQDSDSDDDGTPATAANKANPSYYSGAGLLLWDAPSRTVILGNDFNNEWSDFGGKRDKPDRDAWHTASREAAEESLGVLNAQIVNKQRVIAEVRAGSYVCFLLDTTGTKICRQFNDLAKAAVARGKRVEVTQMLRFPVAELVGASLAHQKHCKDVFNTVHPIRGRILRAVRLFHDQGAFR